MEPAERLAAFLAGELSADEHQAVEAELARDAALRAELAAMRRGDEALATEAPTALPDGARDRLLDALAATFDAELGAAATDTAPPTAVTAGTDELAARRRAAATRRSWLVGLGGVAAAVAAIAVIGPTLGGLGAGDDAADMMATESAPEPAFDEDDAAGSLFAAPVGPTLLGSERALDEDGAAELLAADELEAVVSRDLSVDEAAALGGSWAQAFGSGTLYSAEIASGLSREQHDADAADDGTEAAAEEDGELRMDAPAVSDDRTRAGEFAPADLQILGDVSDDDREDVGRCLDTLLEGGGVIVPVLAELVTFDGESAIAFVLASVAPDDTVTRREVWVLARESCEVRYLRQG